MEPPRPRALWGESVDVEEWSLRAPRALCGESVDAGKKRTSAPSSPIISHVDTAQVTGLSWDSIAIAATVPALLGVLAAAPFWRRSEAIFGNIVGTAVIFTFAFAMIWREHVQLDRLVKACIDAGTVCWPEPAAFTRFAIYAFIGLIQVFLVFSLGLRVEERARRRDYAPEWR